MLTNLKACETLKEFLVTRAVMLTNILVTDWNFIQSLNETIKLLESKSDPEFILKLETVLFIIKLSQKIAGFILEFQIKEYFYLETSELELNKSHLSEKFPQILNITTKVSPFSIHLLLTKNDFDTTMISSSFELIDYLLLIMPRKLLIEKSKRTFKSNTVDN